ncbi:hypothetical protein LEP1GSC103_3227 [Leptospira borgpetersenii serovar Javanica str. UI 09931]|uniref:Uncharacterized protein n=5 Tax=Leptospira borgpetersenii TaxID=174 RepID=M3HJP9_LEPBO|nr:hypothetical protein LBBP_02113 [Leptospira borgpetersenii serovar Ballum]EKP14113.1 hypothetical protein LEP1GSC128_2855 [Leptospira borgpetersenii str. 200801926]EKQ90754.1 hypothetical protein LEP1GSC101_0662 [Leptospira borgpetersenii str. UI 09149]EKR00001.1 hypothetical protein LEP1GSC121_3791 [Leptospira borgpetersenii serovar Castellonis str. 200801910]EMF97889.1 hypothetical protein LEP1GSC123_4159 [Leptospira borgpetersenii str. 200701203]EMK14868.1 hypothetical protein LEP1GSC066
MIRILSRISPKVKATKAKYIFWEKISILIQNLGIGTGIPEGEWI